MTLELPESAEGGCHCGAVRFRVVLRSPQAIVCNCSMCTRKGIIHYIVPPEDFELLQGQDVLSTYTFNTGVAKHTFCSRCGIHPFYTPRSHPGKVDVNLRCLDDVELLQRFSRQSFDGRNWEDNVDSIRR